jgi:hypothetical protein
MTKTEAIKLLGGSPVNAAKALGYKSVHAVYVLPDELSQAMADRVRGAALRLNITAKAKTKRMA